MLSKKQCACVFATVLATCCTEAPALSAGTAFTYQGRLKLDGALVNGTADFEFALWDAATGGNQIGSTVAANAVNIANGVFTVELDFGVGAFTGDAHWLEIAVRVPAGGGTFAPLDPRQPLTSAPLAQALPGMYTLPNATSPNVIGGYGSNVIAPGVVGATIAGGGANLSEHYVHDDYGTIGGGSKNQAGNAAPSAEPETAATVAGGMDNHATEAASTVGGGAGNAAGGSYGTVAGGQVNRVTGFGGTVGGGQNNESFEYATVAGGLSNTASGIMATVCGGEGNQASARFAAIGGGGATDPLDLTTGNRVTDKYGTVGGGGNNQAGDADALDDQTTAEYATVGGGLHNTAGGGHSTVPGGADNEAAGAYSFAAGRRAKVDAIHQGAFVWADSTDADFESQAQDTFNVRAKHGAFFTADNLGAAMIIENQAGVGLFATASQNDAVVGYANASDGSGIVGMNTSGNREAYLYSVGVSGFSSTTHGRGVGGLVLDVTSPNGAGVVGLYTNDTFSSANNGFLATANDGVLGEQNRGSVTGAAVRGVSTLSDGTGVIGEASVGAAAYGVWGKSTTGYAGKFSGDVSIVGTLSKSGGSFKIDHPLDPANKYLSHSFVESPDMMNVYNGNVVLDANGEAVVVLPEWFEALNRDFRYQLTAIGTPGPNLHVAEEITGNRFRIAGGGGGMKVSWQVTGIRQDAWAKAHPMAVEQEKPERERGHYLVPELYGQPAEKSVEYAHKGPPAKRPPRPRVRIMPRDADGRFEVLSDVNETMPGKE